MRSNLVDVAQWWWLTTSAGPFKVKAARPWRLMKCATKLSKAEASRCQTTNPSSMLKNWWLPLSKGWFTERTLCSVDYNFNRSILTWPPTLGLSRTHFFSKSLYWFRLETKWLELGRIDILINNAGILRDKNMLRISDEDWDDIIAVHLTAPFRLTRAVFPLMKQNKFGKIVNTTRIGYNPKSIY